MSLVKIEAASNGSPRVVFFNPMPNNTARSVPSLAAYSLAKSGKRVLFFDFYIDHSYLTDNFLHPDRAPKFGVIDWLSGKLENNEHTVFENMVTVYNFDFSGSLYFVPSYGSDTNIRTKTKVFHEQIVEFKTTDSLEKTSKKYRKLIDLLEYQIKPDVIFIDTCSIISNPIYYLYLLGLSTNLLLLSCHDIIDYYNSYHVMFSKMKKENISLNITGQKFKAITEFFPDVKKINDGEWLEDHIKSLRNNVYELFNHYLYEDNWKFDLMDNDAPHTPLITYKIFPRLGEYDSLFKEFEKLSDDQLRSNVGSLVDYITKTLSI